MKPPEIRLRRGTIEASTIPDLYRLHLCWERGAKVLITQTLISEEDLRCADVWWEARTEAALKFQRSKHGEIVRVPRPVGKYEDLR